MSDRLTEYDLREVLTRLCTAYGKPFGTHAAAQLEVWFDHLQHYPRSAVVEAVEHLIGTTTRFPTIAAVKAATRDRIPKTDAERQESAELCQVCKSPFYEADYRIGTLHQHPTQASGTIVKRLRCRCKPVGAGWV